MRCCWIKKRLASFASWMVKLSWPQTDSGWSVEQNYDLKLKVEGDKLTAFVNGEQVLEAHRPGQCLDAAAVSP